MLHSVSSRDKEQVHDSKSTSANMDDLSGSSMEPVSSESAWSSDLSSPIKYSSMSSRKPYGQIGPLFTNVDHSSDSVGDTHTFIFKQQENLAKRSQLHSSLTSQRPALRRAMTETPSWSQIQAASQQGLFTPPSSHERACISGAKAFGSRFMGIDVERANQPYITANAGHTPGLSQSRRKVANRGLARTSSEDILEPSSEYDWTSPSNKYDRTRELTFSSQTSEASNFFKDHLNQTVAHERTSVLHTDDGTTDLSTRWLRVLGMPMMTESSQKLYSIFEEFGALQGLWTNSLLTDGSVVVAYCDLRDAQKALKTLRSKNHFPDHPLDARFVTRAYLTYLAPDDLQGPSGLDLGEVAVSCKQNCQISQSTLYNLFSSRGDLRSFKCVEADDQHMTIFEYYDVRAARLAVQLDSSMAEDKSLKVSFYHDSDDRSKLPSKDLLNNGSRLSNQSKKRPIGPPIVAPQGDDRRLLQPDLSPGLAIPDLQKSFSFRSFDDEQRYQVSQYKRQGPIGSAIGAELPSLMGEHRAYWEGLQSSASQALRPSPVSATKSLNNGSPIQFESYFELPVSLDQKLSLPNADCSSQTIEGSSDEESDLMLLGTSVGLQNSSSYAERARLALPDSVSPRTEVPTTIQTPKGDMTWRNYEAASLNSNSPLSSPSLMAMTDSRNKVEYGIIARGKDLRSTIMIKNIPNKITQEGLKDWVDQTSARAYDFLYLRIDFKNKCNVGYAFINFIDPLDIVIFGQARVGTTWNVFASEKICDVSYANIQGKAALIEKFRNSCIMDEQESYRPHIYYSSGSCKGEAEPFPPPNNLSRKARSTQAAHEIGLFPPLSPSLKGLTPSKDRTSPLSRSASTGRYLSLQREAPRYGGSPLHRSTSLAQPIP